MMAKQRRPDTIVFELEVGGDKLVVVSVPTAEPAGLEGLSPAELGVARDATSGLSNREIARKRGRAVRTIANQLAKVYRKLGVGSRAELAARLAARR